MRHNDTPITGGHHDTLIADANRLSITVAELKRRLQEACDAMKRHDETVEATLLAIVLQLSAFTDFIDSFDDMRAADLAAPLLKLKMALLDKRQGSPAPLLEFSKPSHRPPSTHAREAIEAWAALAMDLLMKAGKKRRDAAIEVARLLNKHRGRWPVDLVERTGRTGQVTASRVENWRDELTGKAPQSVARDYYRQHASFAAEAPITPSERADVWLRYLPTLLSKVTVSQKSV